jgi:hypothetical protein
LPGPRAELQVVAVAVGPGKDAISKAYARPASNGIPSYHWAHSDWWFDVAPIAGDPRVRRRLLEGLDP